MHSGKSKKLQASISLELFEIVKAIYPGQVYSVIVIQTQAYLLCGYTAAEARVKNTYPSSGYRWSRGVALFNWLEHFDDWRHARIDYCHYRRSICKS